MPDDDDRTPIGLFFFTAPPKEPEKKKDSFFDRHFGALMTVVGVVATALFAAFSNLFGVSEAENKPPISQIEFAERFLPAGGAPGIALIPKDTEMRLFASNSKDPDSELSKLRHVWMALPAADDTSPAPCTASDSSCRVYTFSQSEPGDYHVSLVVSDAEDHARNCARWIWSSDLGCRKHEISTVVIRVVDGGAPEIVLKQEIREVTRGETIRLDAGLSQTFDRAEPDISWEVDGRLFARDAAQIAIPTDTVPANQDEIAVNVIARDRLDAEARKSFTIALVAPETVPLPASPVRPPVVVPPIPGPPTGNLGQQGSTRARILLCRGGAELVMTTPLTVGVAGGPCTLPSRIVTNGNAIDLRVTDLTTRTTTFVAYLDPAPDGVSGAPGASGRPGSAPGESGERGFDGKDGADGAAGKDAGPITIVAKTLSGNLRVENIGQKGGDGGAGGPGGNGGSGQIGVPASSGVFDCRRGPGRGGDGGAGGTGGAGGDGGRGGAGGPVTVDIKDFAESALLQIATQGGAPGIAGRGGAPGRGGRAGPEGPTVGLCGSAGRNGQPGASGRPGDNGDRPPLSAFGPVILNGNPQPTEAQAKGPQVVGGR
ncbi:MAG: collagen-like protein [Pseudomonadota bacterium]